MITKEEVEVYLEELRVKLDIWGLIFMGNRGKNAQALLDLELTVNQVKDVLRDLGAPDYVDGPKPDAFDWGSPLWVFGKSIKSREIYIKVTLGRPNNEAVCISFHHAEYSLKFPFR